MDLVSSAIEASAHRDPVPVRMGIFGRILADRGRAPWSPARAAVALTVATVPEGSWVGARS